MYDCYIFGTFEVYNSLSACWNIKENIIFLWPMYKHFNIYSCYSFVECSITYIHYNILPQTHFLISSRAYILIMYLLLQQYVMKIRKFILGVTCTKGIITIANGYTFLIICQNLNALHSFYLPVAIMDWYWKFIAFSMNYTAFFNIVRTEQITSVVFHVCISEFATPTLPCIKMKMNVCAFAYGVMQNNMWLKKKRVISL
mgnify:FL=1